MRFFFNFNKPHNLLSFEKVLFFYSFPHSSVGAVDETEP